MVLHYTVTYYPNTEAIYSPCPNKQTVQAAYRLPNVSGKSLTFTVPQFPCFIIPVPLRGGTEDSVLSDHGI